MKKICCGFVDIAGKKHECGKIIEDGPDFPVTHGLCDDCFKKQMDDMDLNGIKK
jgi:hypothetical protein